MQTTSKIFQSPVFYARYPVSGLTPDELDAVLERGWSRSNSSLCSTLAHPVEGVWRASLMLRLPLHGFVFKKRLRKIMRRNERMFRTVIRPFEHTGEKEEIWQGYKEKIHHWKLVPYLPDHLFKTREPADFQSWEVEVYEGTKLVAFSVFDLGRKSLASIEAAYDPVFSKFSLGIFTMLVEIDFALKRGPKYYYPGFLAKDTPMFEYKLRTGGQEFFRPKTGEWKPWETLQENDWLFEEVLLKLRLLQLFLQSRYINSGVAAGFFFSKPASTPSLTDYNVFLICPDPPDDGSDWRCAFCWDPLKEHFKAFEAKLVTNYQPGISDLSNKMISVYDVLDSTFTGSFGDFSQVFDFCPPGNFNSCK